MGRLIARLLTAAVVVAAVVAAVNGIWYLTAILLMIAVAAPIGRWIAHSDDGLRKAGSDHTTPPAGLGPNSWGGGGG